MKQHRGLTLNNKGRKERVTLRQRFIRHKTLRVFAFRKDEERERKNINEFCSEALCLELTIYTKMSQGSAGEAASVIRQCRVMPCAVFCDVGWFEEVLDGREIL